MYDYETTKTHFTKTPVHEIVISITYAMSYGKFESLTDTVTETVRQVQDSALQSTNITGPFNMMMIVTNSCVHLK